LDATIFERSVSLITKELTVIEDVLLLKVKKSTYRSTFRIFVVSSSLAGLPENIQ